MARSGFETLFDELFDDSFIRAAFAELNRDWTVEKTGSTFPPHNISSNKDGTLIIELALAGYEPDQVSIKAEDRHLIVESVKDKAEKKDEDYYSLFRGIRGAKFRTRFPVPSKFALDKASATFKNGLMVIKVPLADEKKPVDIPIQS